MMATECPNLFKFCELICFDSVPKHSGLKNDPSEPRLLKPNTGKECLVMRVMLKFQNHNSV